MALGIVCFLLETPLAFRFLINLFGTLDGQKNPAASCNGTFATAGAVFSILSIITYLYLQAAIHLQDFVAGYFHASWSNPSKKHPIILCRFHSGRHTPPCALQDSPSSAKVRRMRLLPRLWHQWTFCNRNQLIFRPPFWSKKGWRRFHFLERLEPLADLQWFVASLQLNVQNATLASQEALFTQLLRITCQAKRHFREKCWG